MSDDGITPDWDALTEEATELLSAYIRVDTVNPPGNETRACDFYGRSSIARASPTGSTSRPTRPAAPRSSPRSRATARAASS